MHTPLPFYQRFKKSGILGFSLFAVILLLANSSNPPNGRTAAPGDGNCTNCHSANSASLDGDISISGLPSTIVGNTTYPITVTLTNPNGNAVRGGFQWVALDGTNTNTGTMSNPSTGTTLTTALGRTYHEHNPAMNFPASNTITWTTDWTAPAGPDGENITFYVGSIIANGSGTSGDRARFSTTTGTLMAAAAPLSVSIGNVINVDCFGDATGSAEAFPTGGATPYSYSWSNSQMAATATGLVAGIYTVTVTDNANNTATDDVVITENSELFLVEQTNQAVSCQGGADGQASVIATGGTSPYLYSWSNGTTGSQNTGLTAGTYSVTVFDNKLCEKTIQVVIADGAVINTISTLEQDVSCNGGADGKIEILASGGVTPYMYNWSNGESTALIENLTAGTYSLTVTDANTCSSTSEYTINEPLPIDATVLSLTNPTCHNGSNGQITAEASNGMAPYVYTWSNMTSGPINTNLSAGSYTLSITDANNCMIDTTFILTEPDSILITLSQINDVSCFGDADGSLGVLASGGAGSPYSYSWSNMMDTSNISDLGPGIYSVIVSDSIACTNEMSFEIVEPFALMANISSEPEFEPGSMDGSAMANPTGGIPPYDYLWNNGAMTMSIQDLSQGSYTVTVSDVNNCTSIETVIVSLSTCDLEVVANTESISCAGETDGKAELTIMNAIGITNILWSNGSDSIAIEDVAGGNYSVTVTDAIGCEVIVNNIIISEPGVLMAFPRIAQSIECAGDSSGAITTLIVGGTAPFDYLWQDGTTNDTLSGIPGGAYAYTITDANDCSTTGNINIGNSDLQSPNLVIQDFNIYIDSFGNVETYDESYFDLGSSDNCDLAGFTFDILDLECNELGDYKIGVSLFDVNGNFSRDSVTVTLLDTIAPIFQCSSDTLFFDGCDEVTFSRPLVNDNCSLETLDVNLTTGQVSGSVFPIGNTDIIYTAIDANGNESNCHFVVVVEASLSLDFVTEDPSCFNFSDGNVEIIVNNSVAGDSTVTIAEGFDPNFLGEGTYFVTVQDASSCEVTDSFTLVDPPILIIDMTEITPSSTSNSDDGAIDISVSGGVGILTYTWIKDGVTIDNTSEDLSNVGPGTYQVIIMDENGCTFTSLDIIIDALVSTDNPKANGKIEIYPNPVTNQLFVRYDAEKNKIDKVDIYDAQGKLALKNPTIYEDACIDMRTLEKGLYIIKIYSINKVYSEKIIKL